MEIQDEGKFKIKNEKQMWRMVVRFILEFIKKVGKREASSMNQMNRF
jgi:hypothetical protein